ncbi:hypothetical protein M595_2177 [Lyngbya aestuarii BL J]|uniref:Uncharacterized protein n=1 Tax=Lyngbya aestuarii BL J TaxID=1348334 RepID=U7QIN6_9CYAN|nr:hypothetical protein M595_2177 [Lyngbya aestuarii BL J]
MWFFIASVWVLHRMRYRQNLGFWGEGGDRFFLLYALSRELLFWR